MLRFRTVSALLLAAAAALTMTACGPASGSGDDSTTQSQTPGHEVEAPQRIAALDYESAEVIAELGLADRLVLIPEAVTNPAIGGHVDEMSRVPNTFPVAANLEAETVISATPDLVVMSARHGAEETIGSVLEQAGLTVLHLPEAWTDPESAAANIVLIGRATGTDEAAQQLAERITTGLNEHTAAVPGDADPDAPRVLVLTNQAGRPFVTAGDAYPLHLLNLAGADIASDDLGIGITGPISVEQVLEAAPDGIVLIDMNGSGDRIYAEMLANPAVAALPAIAGDHVLRVQGREVQALGLSATVDGLAKLSAWVETLR